MNRAIRNITEKVNNEKERLVFERCCERIETGEPIDFSKEMLRRFPRIKMEIHRDGSEHYYWNDGSEDGLHLISFYYTQDIDMIDYKVNFGFTYK